MSVLDIGAMCVAEIIGDFSYKEFANNGGIESFSIGSLGYVGVIWFLIKSLQGSQVLLVNAAWDGMSALLESIAAMVFLGERFDDPWKYLGVIFIIAGLFFLKMPIVNPRTFVWPSLFR